MDSQKQQIVDKLKEANNILVTVQSNPTIDSLSSCIGLTLFLNELGKHATAVFSGEVPHVLEFLQPEKTIESNTDSLRDFIISLDKSKADKLRYKVEDKVVKIFITPYKTSINDRDLEFSQGDFNVDAVVAIGVHDQSELDQAVTAHGRILHDATVISLNTAEGDNLGSINWTDKTASSLAEMTASLVDPLGKDKLDNQIATAFLTGIVEQTERFSNNKTTPKTMSISAKLLTAGANQELVASKLAEPEPEPEPEFEEPYQRHEDNEETDDDDDDQAPPPPPMPKAKAEPGTLEIDHTHDQPFEPQDQAQAQDEDTDTDEESDEKSSEASKASLSSEQEAKLFESPLEVDKKPDEPHERRIEPLLKPELKLPELPPPPVEKKTEKTPSKSRLPEPKAEKPKPPVEPKQEEKKPTEEEEAEQALHELKSAQEANKAKSDQDDVKKREAEAAAEKAAEDFLRNKQINIDDQGHLRLMTPEHRQFLGDSHGADVHPESDEKTAGEPAGESSKFVLSPPTLGGTLTANSRPDDAKPEEVTDPLSLPKNDAPLLEHDSAPAAPSASGHTIMPPSAAQPLAQPSDDHGAGAPPSVPSETPSSTSASSDLSSARSAVDDAVNNAPESTSHPNPLAAAEEAMATPPADTPATPQPLAQLADASDAKDKDKSTSVPSSASAPLTPTNVPLAQPLSADDSGEPASAPHSSEADKPLDMPLPPSLNLPAPNFTPASSSSVSPNAPPPVPPPMMPPFPQ